MGLYTLMVCTNCVIVDMYLCAVVHLFCLHADNVFVQIYICAHMHNTLSLHPPSPYNIARCSLVWLSSTFYWFFFFFDILCLSLICCVCVLYLATIKLLLHGDGFISGDDRFSIVLMYTCVLDWCYCVPIIKKVSLVSFLSFPVLQWLQLLCYIFVCCICISLLINCLFASLLYHFVHLCNFMVVPCLACWYECLLPCHCLLFFILLDCFCFWSCAK